MRSTLLLKREWRMLWVQMRGREEEGRTREEVGGNESCLKECGELPKISGSGPDEEEKRLGGAGLRYCGE